MNDCILCMLGKCEGFGCADCTKYVSMNSERGHNLIAEYEQEIQKVVDKVSTEFYNKHFGGNSNEQ